MDKFDDAGGVDSGAGVPDVEEVNIDELDNKTGRDELWMRLQIKKIREHLSSRSKFLLNYIGPTPIFFLR